MSDIPQIIECSSIYAIDYAAILFSNLLDNNTNFLPYINNIANTGSINTQNRKYISRLAIPTLNFDSIDDDLLRQIHFSIEKKTINEFLDQLRNAIDSYNVDYTLEYNQKKITFINSLKKRIILKDDKSSIDYYITLIELILLKILGKEIKINKFEDFRKNGFANLTYFFIREINEYILSNLKHGKYKFIKGGTIEVKIGNKWECFKEFVFKENTVQLINDNQIVNIDELQTKKTRFRGPLESNILCFLGVLIDFPWYSDGQMSSQLEYSYYGIEYISPISVSFPTRVSKKSGGQGYRLFPSGYSLIEYKSHNVLRILAKLLPNEKSSYNLEDLDDWIEVINNYPISKQKIAKCLKSVQRYCDQNIKMKYEMKLFEFDFEYRNFLQLGNFSVSLICLIRIIRCFFSPKSPTFNDIKLKDRIINSSACIKGNYFTLFQLALEKQQKISHMYNYGENKVGNTIKYLQDNISFIIEPVELTNHEQCKKISNVFSKLEKLFIKNIYSYYEISVFISGVLLKANIFSAYWILQDDYKNCIENLINEREIKKYYFYPKNIQENSDD